MIAASGGGSFARHLIERNHNHGERSKDMIKRLLIALMALGMFSASALAAPPAFQDVDKNKDGTITAEEAAMVEGLSMAAADANGDGKLSRQEYEAAAKKL